MPCVKIIEKFEFASGSKLNKLKTKILAFFHLQDLTSCCGISIPNASEMILGVPAGDKICDEYWSKLIAKMKAKLDIWKHKDQSLEGKIHLIKSIGILSVLYAIEIK